MARERSNFGGYEGGRPFDTEYDPLTDQPKGLSRRQQRKLEKQQAVDQESERENSEKGFWYTTKVASCGILTGIIATYAFIGIEEHMNEGKINNPILNQLGVPVGGYPGVLYGVEYQAPQPEQP